MKAIGAAVKLVALALICCKLIGRWPGARPVHDADEELLGAAKRSSDAAGAYRKDHMRSKWEERCRPAGARGVGSLRSLSKPLHQHGWTINVPPTCVSSVTVCEVMKFIIM